MDLKNCKGGVRMSAVACQNGFIKVSTVSSKRGSRAFFIFSVFSHITLFRFFVPLYIVSSLVVCRSIQFLIFFTEFNNYSEKLKDSLAQLFSRFLCAILKFCAILVFMCVLIFDRICRQCCNF